ncbi:cysteine protease [Cryptosporidium ubiquitum]|uniref:Cysteine protease n=1 Tax=Cryptosporidium ubiquitum TaxID=857276 RepID=A0A1J4MFK5_9CRYT|nr:cysteine protease [Cryptosporidium ubiquitum]OII72985.1 cysteine protease [Cryptosporidium ubiquitum]
MSIIEELEKFDIHILGSLLSKLNTLEITQDEIGESFNVKYFAIGYYHKNRKSNRNTVIISDVVKLNFLDWDKSITEFIEDIVISLPEGFTVLGSIQSKSDCMEWLNITKVDFKKHNSKYGKFWDPNNFPNLLIVPEFDMLSIISSLKIFLINHNANYLLPDSRIQIIKDLSELGEFYCCEIHISLPLISTNFHESNKLDSNISSIEEIIESNLVVQAPNFLNNNHQLLNIYNYNKNYKIINKDLDSLPIQIPVFFSQNIQPVEINSNETSTSHFFTSYTIINNDEKSFQKINLHLQACIFKLKKNDEFMPFQNIIKKRFIDQCNYIKERVNNPTRLFYYSQSNSSSSILSDNYDFEFYLFKIPQISFPITLLNTGILFEKNPEKKTLRKLWSNILNINPLMPFITKNLALIPKLKNESEDLKYYNEKLVSPHLPLIEKMKSKNLKIKNKKTESGLNQSKITSELDPELDFDFELSLDTDFDFNSGKSYSKIQKLKLPIIYQCYGDFYYYHYNHDNFKDNGWGCTYRSLQMVLSWYLINNYTNKHVLSIPEIQDFLKQNDPTHSNLEIGSNSWIGTVEASYILLMYLGISCKLKYFYDIEEFLKYYDKISEHFQKISTPIILSIGDYSYLLVAIQISKDPSSPFDTNNVQYLLVDPHYTGKDDYELIYKKNGVSWKNASFFKSISKDKYVNILLPLNTSEKDSQIIY